MDAHRLEGKVGQELLEYFGRAKRGPRRPATSLSHEAMHIGLRRCQAALGTDLEWARKEAWKWGKWGGKVEAMFKEMEDGAREWLGGDAADDDGVDPLWTVGESDLEDGEWESDWEGRKDDDGSVETMETMMYG